MIALPLRNTGLLSGLAMVAKVGIWVEVEFLLDLFANPCVYSLVDSLTCNKKGGYTHGNVPMSDAAGCDFTG